MNSSLPQPRVAFIHLDLQMGGGLIFTLNLACELMRRGVCCEVFSLRETNRLQSDFARLGMPVHSVPGERLIFEDRVAALLEKVKAFRPTAVVAGSGGETCEVLRYLPGGVSRIYVVHLALAPTIAEAALYWREVDLFVGVSDLVCDGLKKTLQGKPVKIHCIEPGIPVSKKQARSEAILAGEPLRLLYLGRLDEEAKRVRMFPAIFQRLQALGIPFTWTIAGDGPERTFLESRMVSTQPDQKVGFRGVIPYGEVPQLLAEHDVFLLTSDSESFCLSLHEAMACGLTPVVGEIPGHVSEVVTPETGRRVPLEPAEGYADAVVWLHQHRAETVRLAAAARESIGKRYSLETLGEHWMPLLATQASPEPVWPRRWKIQPPRTVQSPLYFSFPLRWLRRLRMGLR